MSGPSLARATGPARAPCRCASQSRSPLCSSMTKVSRSAPHSARPPLEVYIHSCIQQQQPGHVAHLAAPAGASRREPRPPLGAVAPPAIAWVLERQARRARPLVCTACRPRIVHNAPEAGAGHRASVSSPACFGFGPAADLSPLVASGWCRRRRQAQLPGCAAPLWPPPQPKVHGRRRAGARSACLAPGFA